MIETVKKWANRATRRLAKKKGVEVIIRSESMVEVLENALGRKLDHSNAADMGLLDQFVDMNNRLTNQPPSVKERVRKLWYEELQKMNEQGEPNVSK